MNFSKLGSSKLSLPTFAMASALFAFSLALTGCTGSSSTTVGTAAQVSTGTIEGTLRDRGTNDPIVGAVIDIGVASATTNSNGTFAMYNITVPVDANNQATVSSYKAMINLSGVSSPVNMGNAAATPRYSKSVYTEIAVSYTPVYTAAPAASAVIPTPANGLIAAVDLKVGKLASTITGTLGNSSLQAVGSGWTVNLLSAANTATTGTGATGNIVLSAVTDANGVYTFANIESGQLFTISAFNTPASLPAVPYAGTQTYIGTKAVTALSDGQTKVLSLQGSNTASVNDAVLVSSVDTIPPIIAKVTPEYNSDNAAVAAGTTSIDVVFTFSEPILQTALTNASSVVTGSLYDLVAVSRTGSKSGNIAHSLAWNSTFTTLTVTIPNLAIASWYSVDLAPALTATLLKDMSGNGFAGSTDPKKTLVFSTYGSLTPSAGPTGFVTTNAAPFDFNTATASFDWLPVSGAKSYNLYRQQTLNGAVIQGYQYLANFTASEGSDSLAAISSTPFVSADQNKLAYNYIVKAVSLDNIESLASVDVVSISDTTKPTVAIPANAGNVVTLTVVFSEPVNEVAAETNANYVFGGATPPVLSTTRGAVLQADRRTVILTFSPAAASTVTTLSIANVTDIAGNVMTSSAAVTF